MLHVVRSLLWHWHVALDCMCYVYHVLINTISGMWTGEQVHGGAIHTVGVREVYPPHCQSVRSQRSCQQTANTLHIQVRGEGGVHLAWVVFGRIVDLTARLFDQLTLWLPDYCLIVWLSGVTAPIPILKLKTEIAPVMSLQGGRAGDRHQESQGWAHVGGARHILQGGFGVVSAWRRSDSR